ncbi:MAG: hypothetical protein NTY51_09695 [Deltaproteobacteria bacterium]|nr:hypothetical protein [Deltaproteobacteria bacterium]
MRMLNASGQETRPKPYQPLRDDPKFDQIRRLINDFPPEKLLDLKKYINSLEKASLRVNDHQLYSRSALKIGA